MTLYTFDDITRHRRCPYEFRLDRKADVWRITAEECMGMAVRDAVLACEHRRVLENRPVDADYAKALFWESWDRHLQDVAPVPEDTMGLIRYGERCMEGYLRSWRRYEVREIAAVGMSGTIPLRDGDEILVSADEVMVRGSSATVCRYMCDPRLGSSSELSSDARMLLAAKWALDNISGCRSVRMRWIYLTAGTVTEATARRESISSALSYVADAVYDMSSERTPLPRESEHCLECPYMRTCPRKIHELMLSGDPSKMSLDEGVRLVDAYAEMQEKIDALRARQRELEARRDAIGESLIAYADANGFMSVKGHGYKALVRHETKAELPEDKTYIIEALRASGLYESRSMPNYPRIRADIAKGVADPRIAGHATVTEVGKVYLRRSGRSVQEHQHPGDRDLDAVPEGPAAVLLRKALGRTLELGQERHLGVPGDILRADHHVHRVIGPQGPGVEDAGPHGQNLAVRHCQASHRRRVGEVHPRAGLHERIGGGEGVPGLVPVPADRRDEYPDVGARYDRLLDGVVHLVVGDQEREREVQPVPRLRYYLGVPVEHGHPG